MNKYKLIKEKERTLNRIVALRDLSDVKKGEKGGLIEKEANLSQEGNCWVSGNAWVFGEVKICQKCGICGKKLKGFYGKDIVWTSERVGGYNFSAGEVHRICLDKIRMANYREEHKRLGQTYFPSEIRRAKLPSWTFGTEGCKELR